MNLSEKGFSFLETLVALMSMVFLTTMLIPLSRMLKGTPKQIALDATSESEFNELVDEIRRVGRAAYECSITDGLQCSVDFGNPPTGNLTQVKFRFVPGQHPAYGSVQYSKFVGGAWGGTMSYPGIASFTLCGDSELRGVNTCPVQPQKINQVYVANNPTPLAQSRYFRYAIKAAMIAPSAKSCAAYEGAKIVPKFTSGCDFVSTTNNSTLNFVTYQGSFTLRNPSTHNVFYVWGERQ